MICITAGDANGVGPEILLKAAARGELTGPYVVIGDIAVLRACAKRLGIPVRMDTVSSPQDVSEAPDADPDNSSPISNNIADPRDFADPRDLARIRVIDAGLLSETDIEPGRLSRRTGSAAVRYVEQATRLALDREVSAIVTLPINKEAARMDRPDFTGHTELIADLCGKHDYTMMLISDKFAVTHVSTHVPMAEAVTLVQKERVHTVIRLTHQALSRLHASPRIAVAGLNPHAGEHGAFGSEDAMEILPAIEAARALGWDVVGPEPPDTVFYRASKGLFDAVVCMYHDQGHIPMKLLDFEGGVNVTLGLQVVRTSVDHGTAFDIAWQGKASTHSFVQAYRFAQKLGA